MKEVKLKVEFWELAQKVFTKMGGIFIVLDVTALAFAQIIIMRETEPWEKDLILVSSEEATGQAGSAYFRSCFENVHTRRSRDTV